MVDALLEGVEYLDTESPSLSGLASAICKGAQEARELVAKKGRSAYIEDKKIKGLAEPGCELAAFLFSQMK